MERPCSRHSLSLIRRKAQEEPQKLREFPGTFQIYRTHDDVIMDMVPVYVRADDKSVVSLRQPHGKFLTDLIGFLRRHFTWLKRLPEMIGNHIIRTPDSAGLVDILPLG